MSMGGETVSNCEENDDELVYSDFEKERYSCSRCQGCEGRGVWGGIHLIKWEVENRRVHRVEI